MLSVKNLCKTYRPKKGVPVCALDHVSLTFPETGLVFLLGKSGSGKSTLLNLLGGLDRPDEGELIFAGASFSGFSQSDYDSYRNTYVGSIFQEYNLLPDFTVGANVALALQLQSREATDENVSEMLARVDLAGMGARKPSELSGGQKQRVAIARALIKDPAVLLADEPTGALDSVTGRQVLDTLKKLSKEKLVVVVSHDRDFARKYADRIIELSDGRVISDVTRQESDGSTPSLSFEGPSIAVPQGYHLTEEDRKQINDYLDSLASGAVIQPAGEKASLFRETDPAEEKPYEGLPFTPIRSRLPLRVAFPMGASGLKHKKVRLVFTILLSCIAFTLFGLSDVFAAYEHVSACVDSLSDSNVTYLSLTQETRLERVYDYDDGEKETVVYYDRTLIGEKELREASEAFGVPFAGIYAPESSDTLSFSSLLGEHKNEETGEPEYSEFCPSHFRGLAEIAEENMKDMNYSLLAGRLPKAGEDETAISAYAAEAFLYYGLCAQDAQPARKVRTYDELVGLRLPLGSVTLTVTGIVDTGLDIERYRKLDELSATENENGDLAMKDLVLAAVMREELDYAADYSFTGALLLPPGGIDRFVRRVFPGDRISFTGGEFGDALRYVYFHNEDYSFASGYGRVMSLSEIDPADVHWVDGEKTVLADDEMILTTRPYLDLHALVTADGDVLIEDKVIDEAAEDEDVYLAALGKLKLTGDELPQDKTYRIVGYLSGLHPAEDTIVVSDSLKKKLTENGTDKKYECIVGPMPEGRGDMTRIVKKLYSGQEDAPLRYKMRNNVVFELDNLHEIIEVLADVFLWVGVAFAVFASLLLANFIATSISYKKRDIGILRAIGSRGTDVYRIFASESLLIAAINYVITCTVVFIAVLLINRAVRLKAGLLITFLHFGLRQLLLLAFVSALVALLASFLPVFRSARKKPIDAINDK